MAKCAICEGKGSLACTQCKGKGDILGTGTLCSICEGVGITRCETCDGKGLIEHQEARSTDKTHLTPITTNHAANSFL